MSGGILRFPWTTQPQSPVDIDPYWLARGLVFLNLGNGVYWKKDKGWSTIATITGGPKTNASKFGKVKGFGSTNGTGSTDRIDLPAIPMATGFRSIVAHLFANSTGGGTFGRVWQDVSGTGTSAGESFYINTSAGFTYYRQTSGTQGGHYSVTAPPMGVWFCAGLTADQTSTAVAQIPYLNGVKDTTTVTTVPDGTYTVGTTTPTFGNRASGDRGWNGMLGPIALFDHPTSGLTAAEHKALYTNIWQLLAPVEHRIWVPAAAGGDSQTNESVTLTDSQSASTVFAEARAESITLTDAQTVSVVFAPRRDESVTLTDSQNATNTVQGQANESVTLTDAQTAQAVFAVTEAETVTLTDGQTAQADFAVQRDETVTLTDSQNGTVVTPGANQTDELLTLTDGQTSSAVFAAQRDESVILTDGQVASAVFAVTETETVTLTDSQNGTVVGPLPSQVDESLTLTDAQTVIATLNVTVNESISLFDGQTGSIPGSGKSGVNRQWLIDYYTQEQAKKSEPTIQGLAAAAVDVPKPIPGTAKTTPSAAKLKKTVVTPPSDVEVAAAETAKILKSLSTPVQSAQDFKSTLKLGSLTSEVSALEAQRQAARRKRQQEDEELLLFSMVL